MDFVFELLKKKPSNKKYIKKLKVAIEMKIAIENEKRSSMGMESISQFKRGNELILNLSTNRTPASRSP
jgi:hypothetical protein